MTILELAERDLRKAKRSLELTKKIANVPEDQLRHTKELVALRDQIRNVCAMYGGEDNEQREAD